MASNGSTDKAQLRLPYRAMSPPRQRTCGTLETFEGNRAVIVSDMSGFTRTVQQYGVVHFACIILRMREILYHAMKLHNVQLLETEADDVIGVFSTVKDALYACADSLYAVRQYNESLTDKSHQINISGFGIGWGNGLLVDSTIHKVFGPPFSGGFEIGENHAENGSVLLTFEAGDALEPIPSIKLEKEQSEDGELSYLHAIGVEDLPHNVDISQIPMEVPNIPRHSRVLTAAEWVAGGGDPAEAKKSYEYFLLLRSLRATDPSADAEIREKFMIPSGVILLIGLDMEAYSVENGAEMGASLLSCLASQFKQIAQDHNGVALAATFFLFKSAEEALQSGLACKEIMKRPVPLKGLGIHCGELLIVPGSDIQFGDPINIASKLAEDTAKNGEFFITKSIYETVARANRNFESRSVVVSKVKIECYVVVNTKRKPSLEWPAAASLPVPVPREDICTGCGLPVLDNCKIAMGDKPWHPKCFTCTVCEKPIEEDIFITVDGRQAHEKCRPKRSCAACGRPVLLTARQAFEKVWHPNCFTCAKCKQCINERVFLLHSDIFCGMACLQDAHAGLHSGVPRA